MAKRGLYANIHAKRNRIKRGSGEKMRKPTKGAKALLLILEELLRQRRNQGGEVNCQWGHYGKRKNLKLKIKSLQVCMATKVKSLVVILLLLQKNVRPKD